MAPSAPEEPAGKIDWVFVNSSNVHVANHRDWFTSYTPFRSSIGGHVAFPNEPRFEVLGIGTVELNVRLYATPKTKRHNYRVLVLHNVLHAPEFICNILGSSIVGEYEVKIDLNQTRPSVLEIPCTGVRAGLFQKAAFFHLRLYGRKAGQSSLQDSGRLYMVGASWSEEERAKWEAFEEKKTGNNNNAEKSTGKNYVAESSDNEKVPPYTDVEKKWLKEHYKGEFKFLQVHGLSIYQHGDREDGRRLVREIMMEDNKANQKKRKAKGKLAETTKGVKRLKGLSGEALNNGWKVDSENDLDSDSDEDSDDEFGDNFYQGMLEQGLKPWEPEDMKVYMDYLHGD